MKKTIFLVDADDTILDFHGASSLALQDAFISCGLEWKEEYKEKYKAFNDSLWEKLERKEITRYFPYPLPRKLSWSYDIPNGLRAGRIPRYDLCYRKRS